MNLLRRIGSLKLGLALMGAILVFTLCAAFYPSSEIVGFVRSAGRSLGLENVAGVGSLSFQERFESAPFLLLFMALNLILCCSLYFRIRGELIRARAVRARRSQTAAARAPGGPVGPAITIAEEELRQRGYRTEVIRSAGALQVIGSRGNRGFWGSVLLHLSILLVSAAVVLGRFASFSASIHLTEGQAFDARTDRYGVLQAGAWYSPPPEPLTFRVARIEPQHRVNGSTTVATVVEPTVEGKATRFFPPVPVYLNHGLRHAGVTIHQGANIGYAPQLVLEDAEGKNLIAGFLRLTTSTSPANGSEIHRDFVEPRRGLRVVLELLPDAVYRNGVYSARSSEPRNPVLHVTVQEDKTALFDRFVPMQGTATEAGYTVHFDGLRRWSQIDVVDDPAPIFLVAATLLGSLGLGLRLLCVRRRVVVSLRCVEHEVMFDLSGSTEKFHRTFEEELSALRAALAARLAAPTTPVAAQASQPSWASLIKQS